jgi:hypothetical protein
VTAGAESSLLTYIVQADRLFVDFAVTDTDADLVRAALAGANAAHVGVTVTDAQGKPIGGMGEIEFGRIAFTPRWSRRTETVSDCLCGSNTRWKACTSALDQGATGLAPRWRTRKDCR